MKIRFKKEKKLNFINIILNRNFFYKFYFFFTLILFTFFFFLFFQTGFWENNKKEFSRKINLNGIVNYIYLPEIYFYKLNSFFESQKEIKLDISQKNLIKIENNRNKIMEFTKKVIPFEKAEAFIQSDGKMLRSEIRLKGDRKIHYENRDTSSYRIEIKKGEVFDEMKKFSIQKPRIRNYLHEWIFHELLGYGGLVKIKYDFYNFYLNGKYLGYYSLEESFGKILLERNKRRNGPIFGLNEEINELDDKNKYEVYNKNYWEKPENLILVKSAIQKLDNYFSGKEPLENVFDIEKWSWFFAVSDLTYTYHGVQIASVKLYYNPINGKFEPIGFDGHRLVPNFSQHILNDKPILNETNFSIAKKKNIKSYKGSVNSFGSFERDFFYQKGKLNENFFKSYVNAVNTISSKKFLDNFFEKRKKKIKKINSGIYSDTYIYDYDSQRKSGIGIYYFNKEDIYRRAQFLLKEFSSLKTKLHIEETENELIFYNNDFNSIFLSDGKILCGKYQIKIKNLKLNKDRVFYKKDRNYNNQHCNKISFINNASQEIIEFKINKYNSYEVSSVEPPINNFLEFFDKKDDQLFLKNKFTKINKNIFIPKGYEVIIRGGEVILLENNSFIFSNSHWKIGDTNQRTLIGGKKENLGGGLIVYDTQNQSHIINCDFENLVGLKKNELLTVNDFSQERLIMGSINFFQTNVIIENTKFKNIFSEDAVNIVSSNYSINETFFENIKSDAIDIDFSNGRITNSEFLNIQNDAIDFSGSKSEIYLIQFKNVGDKGVSVGENSNITINQIKGQNSIVGIATKDGSKTVAKNISFTNIDYPFASYRKKKAYDYGKLYLEDFTTKNFKKEFINDSNSLIINNRSNKEIGINNSEVDKIIENII